MQAENNLIRWVPDGSVASQMNEITPRETQLRRMLNPLLALYEKNIPGPKRGSGSLAEGLPNH